MEKTTEQLDRQADAAEFYDAIAAWYDDMTSFRMRFVHERPFFHLLVERFKIRSAIDAGAGTGFHAILLAQLGVDVTAVDVSDQMLNRVRNHAAQYGVMVKTLRSSFQELRANIEQDVDAVFCMGNSLAHLLKEDDLKQSLEQFYAVLKPSGALFVQTLNYDRILVKRERIQSVREVEGTLYVRFYDYENDVVRFNILRIWRTPQGLANELQTTTLRPVLHDRLVALVEDAGFQSVKSYGSISLEDFRADESRDLVVLARKLEK